MGRLLCGGGGYHLLCVIDFEDVILMLVHLIEIL